MLEKEFVNGDAFIASREWKNPTVCNICNKETLTVIKVPSLSMYLAWCENCKTIPKSAWHIPKKLSQNKLLGETETDRFDSLIEEFEQIGCNYKNAKHNAINEVIKYQREVAWETIDYQKSNNSCYIEELNYFEQEEPPLVEETIEFLIDTTFQAKIYDIIDFNHIIKKVLPIINDEEREILTVIIEKFRLDEIMTEELRNEFYQELNTNIEEFKYNNNGMAYCLGYKKGSALERYRIILNSLISKCKDILITSRYINRTHTQLELQW